MLVITACGVWHWSSIGLSMMPLIISASPMIWQCKLDNLRCQRIGNGRSFGNVISFQVTEWPLIRLLQLQLRMVTTCYNPTLLYRGDCGAHYSCNGHESRRRPTCSSQNHLQQSSSAWWISHGSVDHGKQTMTVHTYFHNTWVWDFETGCYQTILES